MMYIAFYERKVVRETDPKAKNRHAITKMTKKHIDTYSCYDTTVIPRVDEIIYINDKGPFKVLEVIHKKNFVSGLRHDAVYVEVKPHACKHIYSVGNYSFTEDWPLIVELAEEISAENEYD